MRSSRLILVLILLLAFTACREEPAPTPPPAAEESLPTAAPTDAPTAAPTATALPEPTPEPTAVPLAELCTEPIYLALIWHQHQPVYFQDPDTGIVAKPWVRLHAAKDYVDMAAILQEYPDVKATFNLTPSLIRQLDDISAGTTDLYWQHTIIPAEELTDEQKQFILDRFFDTNRKIVARFPRYQELLELRDGSDDPLADFTAGDFRDLQLLFNLAWTDPDWLAEEPLAALVEQGSGFAEEDKQVVLDEHLRLVNEVIPIHREMQDNGQIEVTTTPFAHPILPLLVSTDLALEAMPDATLPNPPFIFGQDAVAQVERGVQLYTDHFGQAPRGMWPSEGSVAQAIISMVNAGGLQWMASDEGVLAQSILGTDSFTRDSNEVVVEADQLYRPYLVRGRNGGSVAMIFRDKIISDKVGFTYSGVSGDAAADYFIERVYNICGRLRSADTEGNVAAGPHLISVILDGENAWENYDNDGKEFLHALYQRLSDDPLIVTVTPTEFLETVPEPRRINNLWAGSWINSDFSTWIGEEEENRAWDLLRETRVFLQTYVTGRNRENATPEEVAEAFTQMYIAEGSDWFWWYGSDQDSGDDGAFDQQFRNTLKRVYEAVEAEPPRVLDVPIIPEAAASPDRAASGLISPIIDGIANEGEWDAAGLYTASGGVMATGAPVFADMAYGFDARNLYLKIGLNPEFALPTGQSAIELYLGAPGSGAVNAFTLSNELLGFAGNRLLEIKFSGGVLGGATAYQATADGWEAVATGPATEGRTALDFPEEVSAGVAVGEEGQIEIAIPLAVLGSPDVGANLIMRALFLDNIEGDWTILERLPATGPAQVAVPDLGTTTAFLDVADPEGDDTGPGTYTYPTDAVFASGNFDITNFQVGADETNVVFRFTMRGPVDNPWDGPNGLSVQTFDIYIDAEGDSEGGAAFLPGRNLAAAEGFAWDFAITVEGWESKIFTPGEAGPTEIAGPADFQVVTDPGQQKVTIRVPKSILGDAPESWRYAAMALGQEGFPSGGVLRVRDVTPAAEQWRFGGAPSGTTNHSRVIDFVWPEAGQQEEWLSDFTASTAPQGDLTAGDFATVEFLTPEP
jgi:alpha-amylase/alpha-mannosidase (GH57 family)